MIKIPNRMFNRKKPLPDIDLLLIEANRIYKYDKINGGLIWIEAKNPNHKGQTKIGSSVGGDDGHGYKMCMLLGQKFKVHQIVWLLNNNELAIIPIDHIDRNKLNNKIENLRLVNDQQNIFNQSSNVREFSGVCLPKKDNKFVARIQLNGKKIYLGRFLTKEQAANAYKEAHIKLRGEYAAFNPVS